MKTDETDGLLNKAKLIVEKYYDLGKNLHIEELLGGYVNSSFTIQAKKSGYSCRYVLRKYNPETTAEKIQFEHQFVSHLRKTGFDLAAGIVPGLSGDTYVKEHEIFFNHLWRQL